MISSCIVLIVLTSFYLGTPWDVLARLWKLTAVEEAEVCNLAIEDVPERCILIV